MKKKLYKRIGTELGMVNPARDAFEEASEADINEIKLEGVKVLCLVESRK